jgi:hypothetical protein
MKSRSHLLMEATFKTSRPLGDRARRGSFQTESADPDRSRTSARQSVGAHHLSRKPTATMRD